MTVNLLAPFRVLVVAGFLCATGCAPVSSAPAVVGTIVESSRPTFDIKQLNVQSRHSETVRVGDLSGLMVLVENTSDQAVDKIRIDVSAGYFAGFVVRRIEPAALDTQTGSDAQSFFFKGPSAHSKASYLLTLTPTAEGEFPAEIVVSAKNEATEKLVAILDLSTVVSAPKVLQ